MVMLQHGAACTMQFDMDYASGCCDQVPAENHPERTFKAIACSGDATLGAQALKDIANDRILC